MKRKVCFVTGTRAEYGLLYWLMKEVDNSKDLQLQLIVTGMHLSADFGSTVNEIEKDFKIDCRVNMRLGDDSGLGINKSMALAQAGFANAYVKLEPDLLVVLGDRFEIFSAVVAAMVARIPIAHLHGGETTEGAIDEAIRHSITKMSHLHFVANDEYRHRVIQLGEHPNRVFNVGGMGIESINRLTLLTKSDFEKSIGFKLNKRNLLVTFHPVTLENATAEHQFSELLQALDTLEETHFIFTKANSDSNGRIINSMIDEYVASNCNKSVSFMSLGQLRYLSALQYVDAVVGNSSSGLSEAPSFKIATINVGDRQKGRIRASSIIDCEPIKKAILDAINISYSSDFKKILKSVKNPYGEESPSKKVVDVIRNVPLENLLKKSFFNIEKADFGC